MDNATAPTTVFAIDSDSALIGTIAFVFDKVKKHNQGKYSNLARFSTESYIQHLLEMGIKAEDNGVDADIKRRNEAAYVEAMAKLSLKNDATLEELQVYHKQVSALKRKYGIGGDAQQV